MSRRDPLTLDLLEWEPPKVVVGYGDDVTGRGALDHRISRAIGRALKDAKEGGITRSSVAQKMSDYLGRSVSEDMLNKWASEASGQHRITLDAFVALIDATHALGLTGVVTSSFGLVAVPEKYKDLIDLHMIKEHEHEVVARRQALEAKVRARW